MTSAPSLNPVTSPYGWRTHPVTFRQSFHTGRDQSFQGPTGLEIRAPEAGRITFDGEYGGYGQAMILSTVDTTHLFGHTALVPDANKGDEVAEGQLIATIGSTGISTGRHLHWEVVVAGRRVDPDLWLNTVEPSSIPQKQRIDPAPTPPPPIGDCAMYLIRDVSTPTTGTHLVTCKGTRGLLDGDIAAVKAIIRAATGREPVVVPLLRADILSLDSTLRAV